MIGSQTCTSWDVNRPGNAYYELNTILTTQVPGLNTIYIIW